MRAGVFLLNLNKKIFNSLKPEFYVILPGANHILQLSSSKGQ